MDYRLLCPWDSPGKDTVVGCHFLLNGIFLTQGSNSLHCSQFLYHLSHQRSPILFIKVKVKVSCVQLFVTPWTIQTMEFSRPEYWSGWVAFPFSQGSSQPRDQTQVYHIAAGFFTI